MLSNTEKKPLTLKFKRLNFCFGKVGRAKTIWGTKEKSQILREKKIIDSSTKNYIAFLVNQYLFTFKLIIYNRIHIS